MNRTLSLRYLWWKEFRQLTPLMAVLLAIGGCLHLLFALLGDGLGAASYEAWRHVMVGLALPALFAVGAGALIVGQEREQRTLDWLRSLPITATDILVTKLVSGLVGLLAIWGISLAIAGLMLLLQSTTFAAVSIEILPLFVHSLFLLAVGFTTAWLARSAFFSLLIVVPLAVLPLAATLTQDYFTEASTYRVDQGVVFVVYSLLFALVFSVWAWRRGSKVLGAETVKSGMFLSAGAKSVRLANLQQGALQVVARRVPALLWQFARQNTWAIVGLGLLFYVSIITLAYSYTEPAGILPLIVGLLSTSWLGQLVFQADSVDRRHLFLASRGIPGWHVWLTRQLIPLAILAGGAALMLVLGGFFAFAVLIVPIFTVYASSQFLCQLVRSPILGAIASPIFAFLCASYLVSTGVYSPWLAGLSSLVLFVATFILIRSWMDGRSGWKVPATYLAFLVVAALLPTLPTLYGLGGVERLSATEVQRLEKLAKQASLELQDSDEMPLPVDLAGNESMDAFGDSAAPPGPADAPAGLGDPLPLEGDRLLQSALDQLQTSSGMPSNYVLNALIPQVLLRRMRLEQGAAPDELEKYRLAVKVAFESVRHLRRGISLEVQNQADRLEIALLEELRQPQAGEHLGSELYADIRQQLKNQSARDRARRLAIAAQWWRMRHQSRTTFAEAIYAWLMQPNSDVTSYRLVELTEATAAQRQEFRRFQLANRNDLGVLVSQSIPANLYLEDAKGVPQLLYSELGEYGPSSVNWYGKWEQLAAEL